MASKTLTVDEWMLGSRLGDEIEYDPEEEYESHLLAEQEEAEREAERELWRLTPPALLPVPWRRRWQPQHVCPRPSARPRSARRASGVRRVARTVSSRGDPPSEPDLDLIDRRVA